LTTTSRFAKSAAISMAGDYARRIEDSVDIHFTTVQTAAELHG